MKERCAIKFIAQIQQRTIWREVSAESEPWRRNGKFKRANGRNKTECESAAKFNLYEHGGESAQQMVELSARAQGEQNSSLTVAYILKGK